MRLRFTGFVVFFLLMVSVSAIFAQQRRGRTNPTPASPPAQSDLRITYRSTTAGQSYESTTMIKGKRERGEMRMGYGTDIINITQCDLKRTIQISDKLRKYVITPMQTVEASNTTPRTTSTTPPAEPGRRGGLVKYTTTINDTGERKEMFGFTARHIKSSLLIESSPDACSPMNQRMETDGWYIDLTFGLDCNLGVTQMAGRPPIPPGGCRDEIVTKQIGSGRKGYPLSETTTMYGPDGNASFTSTKEVLDLSREPLDAALFDVPAGYTETTNAQELYGAPPSMASIMGESSQPQTSQPQPSAPRPDSSMASAMAKAPGTLRVGVVAINNQTDRSVSLESLRQRLIGRIESSGIDAIPLSGSSPGELEAEAKAKQCDFILYTDISALKISAAKKLGGLLGRAAGVTGVDKTESRVNFKLFAVGETAPRLQSSATAKEEGDEASAGAAVENEANKVSAEVRKRGKG
ncbi:MAG TPA: hypothetical protein VFH15_10470 [Pyrinomonadaceae bacterium]|nr:hypothetical protein [Pyrinomonadaceae bacterium]